MTLLLLTILATALMTDACGTNCDRCWLGNDPTYCYQCTPGTIWVNNKCQTFEQRTIPGFGRTCAECGMGNYWSTSAKTCKPCRYESAYCIHGFPCCGDDGDNQCTPTFVLVTPTQCGCLRGENFRVKDKCVCPLANTYIGPNGDCLSCTDKCPIGCSDFVCPVGTFLDGCKCTPCHYSCATCSKGNKETNCDTCKSGFDYVATKGLCLCGCCTIEKDNVCVAEGDYTNVNGICYHRKDCPVGQYSDKNGICQCIDSTMVIKSGICVSQGGTIITCPTGYLFSAAQNMCIKAADCVDPYHVNPNTQQCVLCNSDEYYYNYKCVKIVCPTGAKVILNKCQCTQVGYVIWSNNCISTTACLALPNTLVRSGSCVCNTGMTIINNACSCPSYLTYFKNYASCLCPQENQMIVNSKCVLAIQRNCPANSELTTGSSDEFICQCLPRFQLLGGACVACAATDIFSAVDGKCYPGGRYTCPAIAKLEGNICTVAPIVIKT